MARTARPKKISIYDDGVLLVDDADSIDFTGPGVSGSALGNDVTEDITGGGAGTQDLQTTMGYGNVTDFPMRIGSLMAPDFELDVSGKSGSLVGPTFTGTGLNDLSLSGSWTKQFDATYVVEIDGVASPDVTIEYHLDAGSNFPVSDVITGDDGSVGTVLSTVFLGRGNYRIVVNPSASDFSAASTLTDGAGASGTILSYISPMTADTFSFTRDGRILGSNITITGGSQSIGDGLSVTFGATTGHTITDLWTIVAKNNNVVNTSGEYRMQNLDGSFAGISASPSSDGAHYSWPQTSLGDSSDHRFLRNNAGALSWDDVPMTMSIGETVNDAIPGRYFSADETTGVLRQGNSNGWILQESSGLAFETESMVISDISHNLAYQFDLGPHGQLKLGDLGGFWGSAMAEYLDLTFSTYKLQNNGLTTFEDLFSNPFISLDIASKIYGFGDMNNSFNGTSIVIEDSASTILYSTLGLHLFQDPFSAPLFEINAGGFTKNYGGEIHSVQRITGNFTFSATQCSVVHLSALATGTLPLAASFPGQVFVYKNAAGVPTLINVTGSDTIYTTSGAVTTLSVGNGESYTFQSDGVQWNVM